MDSEINHPPHYNAGRFEVIDVIDDWRLNFNLGNAVKYIGRANHKGNRLRDLQKAIWYIKREIDVSTKATGDTNQAHLEQLSTAVSERAMSLLEDSGDVPRYSAVSLVVPGKLKKKGKKK